MTQHRDFKTRVRERMAKTGERYTAARSQLLATSAYRDVAPADYPGLLPGYRCFGGVQSETGLLHNLFLQAGIADPETGAPYTEAMLNGLCGGPGFLYAVFQYAGTPPLVSLIARNKSMPDIFVKAGLERCAATFEVHHTTSAAKATRELEVALAQGAPALCTVDMSGLDYYHLPDQLAGMSPLEVVVAGRNGEQLWLDDRSVVPRAVSCDRFAQARAGYRRGRHRMIIVRPAPRPPVADPIKDAIRQTIYGYRTGDVGVPAQFRANCGLGGLHKWRRLLVDKTRKGWPAVFDAPHRAYLGLRRIYDCIQLDYTAPLAGRPFYAEFLREVAGRASMAATTAALQQAATLFESAGKLWQGLLAVVTDSDPAVGAGCAVSDRVLELSDAGDPASEQLLQDFWAERLSGTSPSRISQSAAQRTYAQLAELLEPLIQVEQEAVAALEEAVPPG